ncbi:MAG: hypothetical protein WBN23_00310, partial [Woeseia sp.]
MRSRFELTFVLLLLSCMPMLSFAQDKFALVNVNVFDGVSKSIRRNSVVLVADGKIEQIGDAGTSVPAGYERIDGGGNYLMPGLFDVHTHIDNRGAAERALASGVTTVRSASVDAFQDVTFRELVRAGKIAGPDMLAAGVYVTPNLGDTVLADPRLVELADGVNTDDE